MGVLFGRGGSQRAAGGYWGIGSPQDLIPPRPFWRPGAPYITADTALRHSAVWAALNLRAGLVSTLPLDIYRRVNGTQVTCPVPEVLRNPAGKSVSVPGDGLIEWLFATQFDLDRTGNAIGRITARDGLNLPARIELAPSAQTSVIVKQGEIVNYRIAGQLYDPSVIWHERCHVVPGIPVGLSPVAYAAFAIREYLTVQEFAQNWFGQGAVPKARLKNTAKTINTKESALVKEMWHAAISANEPFVHGNDWEYAMIQAEHASTDWIDAKKFSITDVARFFGVPADLIDSGETGVTGKLTYQNITQRNMQFLILQLGPAIIRRENALTALTPRPRYVKLNTKAFLRLDPLQAQELISNQVLARTLAPSEARELDDRPPLTPAQVAEFDHFWPPKAAVPAPAPAHGQAPAALPPGEPMALPPGSG
jgi:HK97 family phage portal protein